MDVRNVPGDTAPFLQSATRARHREVVLALLLSLFLHILAFLYLEPMIEWGNGEAPRPDFPTLELSLRTAPLESLEPSELVEPSIVLPVVPSPQAMEPKAAPATAPQAAAQDTTRPGLVLELPEGPGDADTAVSGPAATDNGATVMNSELLQWLNRAERRSGYRPESGSMAPGEFQAGNWVEFIRDGDRCFRVVRADPLQPGSVDMWYRVTCG